MFCACSRFRFGVRVIYGYIAVTLNHVDEVLSVTGKVRFDGARFTGGKESICSESVRNVGASSAGLK